MRLRRKNKGENCMKNWKHCAFTAIIATFGIIVGFIACDNNNGTTPDPIYESVTIHLPTIMVDTVKTKMGEDIVDITFYGNGSQFTATVNGSNKPIQTVTWEIIGDVDTETKITNGVLTVAVKDHGKTITVKAISTVDISKFDTKTITIVQCLPSDFYGKWKQQTNPVITQIISADEIEAFNNLLSYDLVTIFTWETVLNDGSNENISVVDYPCGFYITGERNGNTNYNVRLVLHSNKMSIYRTSALYERVN
jgi:hypothetical protein